MIFSNNQVNMLFNDDFYMFIKNHLNDDTTSLRLKKWNNIDFDVKFAIMQIECRKKMHNKDPFIASDEKFIYPSILLTEQCTSQQIAEFHATLFKGCNNAIDFTAGLCIDAYYLSKMVNKVTAIEIDEFASKIDAINMENLKANVKVINDDSIRYIKEEDFHYNGAFIDPARRDDENNRVFDIEKCNPNVIELIPYLKDKVDFLIIKASPMIDITQSLKQLGSYATDVWVVSVKNDCKELLFKLDFKNPSVNGEHIVHTMNFDNNDNLQNFDFSFPLMDNSVVLDEPISGMYLYEPNSSIMKSGGFSAVQKQFNLSKLHNNTNLYISTDLCKNFPGRVFAIEDVIPYKSSFIKRFKSKYPVINVSTRNFGLSAQQLKDKLKVKDGGTNYLFGVTLRDDSKALILTHKV